MRRELICEAAVELLARGGGHAVSHQAIDRHLALPAGSTSYYFRTRHALLSATIGYLTNCSREAFETAQPERMATPDAASAVITSQLVLLLHERRGHSRARYALIVETAEDPELADLLSGSLFSYERAVTLFRALGLHEPQQAAADLIAVLEGLLFDRLYGRRRQSETTTLKALQAELERPIQLLLSSFVYDGQRHSAGTSPSSQKFRS
ncbi:TetR family transcriptional regulator [Arthrobacter glacialis]|uniref:TetR family transcriptional regulator n=2 Tax=Arthrobacter glacialis TaxID=1664 RepID=A0A2S3ZRC5_ARTGL|nr:TetR family transcriptional regulator [Arthrobacter glacialis]